MNNNNTNLTSIFLPEKVIFWENKGVLSRQYIRLQGQYSLLFKRIRMTQWTWLCVRGKNRHFSFSFHVSYIRNTIYIYVVITALEVVGTSSFHQIPVYQCSLQEVRNRTRWNICRPGQRYVLPKIKQNHFLESYSGRQPSENVTRAKKFWKNNKKYVIGCK